jgi:hypothetical protein
MVSTPVTKNKRKQGNRKRLRRGTPKGYGPKRFIPTRLRTGRIARTNTFKCHLCFFKDLINKLMNPIAETRMATALNALETTEVSGKRRANTCLSNMPDFAA